MTLHEILERRRRQNIADLNERGACHVCGSATRNARGFSHCMEIDNYDDDDGMINNNDGDDNNNDPPEIAEMRVCACFQRPVNNRDPDSCPIRVCEMCVLDDALTGRIRNCGLCGIVACDENCVELVECTDDEEWNNKGCLECRGMESFNEIDLFRRRRHKSSPRINRICTKCLDLFTLVSLAGFSNYQFKCPNFKCKRMLVQSDIVELKRFLKPFPVSMLPEEMLDDIIDFLGAKDLVSTALTCTTLFKKIEKKSKALVESVQHLFPNGPILMEDCESAVPDEGEFKHHSYMYYASGRNSHRLQSPEDGKCWLKVLEKVEKLTADTYFGFQVKAGDEGAAMRYLRSNDRVTFGQTYSSSAAAGATTGIVPELPNNDISVTGGQVMIKRFRLPEITHHHREERQRQNGRAGNRNIIFSVDKMLHTPGVHRVIVRYYCHCERQSIGKVGILSKSESSAEWLGDTFDVELSSSIGVISEELLVGLEFNSSENKLKVYTTDPEEKKIKECAQFDIPEDELGVRDPRNMCFAASLSVSSALFGGNQLSVRSCDSKEWNMFLSHNPNKNLVHRCRGSRSRHGRGEMGRAEMRMRRRMMRPRPEEEDFDQDLDDSDDDSLGDPFHHFRQPMRPRPRPRPRI